MRAPALLTAVALAGCSGSPPPVTAAALAGSAWVETCDGADDGRARVAQVRLDPDGLFGYILEAPPASDWEKDGTDSWSLDGTVLTLSWTSGFAVSAYDLAGYAGGRVEGSTSKGCAGGTFLERAP